MKVKLLKDPIYGYIDIENGIMNDIIDSACFQRLRNIRQTSYSPLYHSSIHNRFIHSIGVYFLGKKAISAIKSSIIELKGETYYNEIELIFTLACLLHDIGHAPFSHSGEKFYIQNQTPSISDQMVSIVGEEEFKNTVIHLSSIGKEAAPHEIMSVIVGIKSFFQYFSSTDKKDFFARCITGYKYINNVNDERSIRNCLIELLNSSIIDVDKLDYIIRDSHTIGFQSVSIDFTRLLNALEIVEKDGKRAIAYHKSALSIIENVIYAHDSERKWIQNHPVVLYEHFLIQHSIRKLEKYYSNNDCSSNLFCYESLTPEGKCFKDKGKIILLADEDVIYNIKCTPCSDDLTWEYFSRNSRRHPIWKSEAEYRDLFDNEMGKNKLDIFEKEFRVIEKYIIENLEIPVINENLIDYCSKQLQDLSNLENGDDEKDLINIKEGIQIILKWANCLKDFAASNEIPFDFVIISANKFRSGFLKEELAKILIDFPSFGNISYIKDVSTILSADKLRENFFYLYYKRDIKKIDIKALARTLYIKLAE